jgi:hypothetical protein
MPLTIYALDTQFAAATGSNVNNGPGTSTFDYPPNSTKDLVISSQPGDETPFIFSPGDTYTVSFGGNGGTTIQDAVVIRSDPVDVGGDQGWAVVFEGLNGNGELVQVVWSPEFDLETWYWGNFSGGNPPGFYTTDASAATYAVPCFASGTVIETAAGPRPVDQLALGDRVLTRDHGPQPVLWVARAEVPGQGRGAPVWFERDILGNVTPLELSQQHRILLSGPEVAARHGVPEVLAPAVSFVNGATIRLAPRPRITYVHLLLPRHEVLSAQGMPVESLLMGRQARLLMARVQTRLPDALMARTYRPARPLLTRRQGAELWSAIIHAKGQKRAMLCARSKPGGSIYVLPRHPSGSLPTWRAIDGLAPYLHLLRGADPAPRAPSSDQNGTSSA